MGKPNDKPIGLPIMFCRDCCHLCPTVKCDCVEHEHDYTWVMLSCEPKRGEPGLN